MWRARSSKPRTSPGDWPIGRPICQEISSAICCLRATNASTKRVTIAARSASGTCFHFACAARARSSVRPICGVGRERPLDVDPAVDRGDGFLGFGHMPVC